MKVFIDTNVLLSAALFPSGVAARACQSIAGAGHRRLVRPRGSQD
ncbi:MAG: hypothetical protein QM569_05080 [Acidovorax sp.]